MGDVRGPGEGLAATCSSAIAKDVNGTNPTDLIGRLPQEESKSLPGPRGLASRAKTFESSAELARYFDFAWPGRSIRLAPYGDLSWGRPSCALLPRARWSVIVGSPVSTTCMPAFGDWETTMLTA